MYREHSVGVVVPAYDEADAIGDVLADLPAFVDVVYAVDDGSSDGTRDEVRRVAEATPGLAVELVKHGSNHGAGAAIATGYRRATTAGLDLVVTVDADGQMNAARMDELLDPLVGGCADYAKGDRLATGRHRDEMPPLRVAGNVLLTVLTGVASGYWTVSDPQNGYTAITVDALDALDFSRFPDSHAYCNDLLVQLNELDADVVDVPMPAIYGDEASTITYTRFVGASLAVLVAGCVRRLHPSRGLEPELGPEG